MRRASRTDRNQNEIIDALRKAGASVQPLHTVHDGVPDLLVGFQGRNFLMEIKDWQKSRLAQEAIACLFRESNERSTLKAPKSY